jgi:hypothetical protein
MYVLKSKNIVTCKRVRVTKLTGSTSDDWIYEHCGYVFSPNHTYYSAIADLHTFQSTVAHAVGFSIFISRLLATDLNTETITSDHYEVFLSSITIH